MPPEFSLEKPPCHCRTRAHCLATIALSAFRPILSRKRKTRRRDGADFIVFGPVYFTPSKAAFGAPQGVTALKKIVEITALPVYAIGGIKPGNITELRSAVGAAGSR